MADPKFSLRFLGNRSVQILTVVLLAQLAGLYAISRQELVSPARPLAEFPADLGTWKLVQDFPVEQDVQEVLKADDLLSRSYAEANGRAASLFVAYFKTQRTGQTPHSPKNCLPGSGWVASASEIAHVEVPGLARPLEVNRYTVGRGNQQSIVIYWYQSRDRSVASEYWAKFYTMADSVRYNRSDTAIIRVVVPVAGSDTGAAIRTAEDFVRAFFKTLREHLPA